MNERTVLRSQVKGCYVPNAMCAVGKLPGSGCEVLKDKQQAGSENAKVRHGFTQRANLLWCVSYNPPT